MPLGKKQMFAIYTWSSNVIFPNRRKCHKLCIYQYIRRFLTGVVFNKSAIQICYANYLVLNSSFSILFTLLFPESMVRLLINDDNERA